MQFAANITFHILFPTITIALGWALLFYYSGLMTFPKEIEEAARVDGATRVRLARTPIGVERPGVHGRAPRVRPSVTTATAHHRECEQRTRHRVPAIPAHHCISTSSLRKDARRG
jgi:hypothetical protein